MQQIRQVHNCLIFKIGDNRYLYGLTYSYIFSSIFLKYKPHYLILPSSAYTNTIFMHFGIDQILQFHNLQLNKNSNSSSFQELKQFCKTLKSIILTTTYQQTILKYNYKYVKNQNNLSIQLITSQPHSIIQQQQLIKIHKQQLIKKIDQNYEQNKGVGAPFSVPRWLGQPISELKLIVNKQGNSSYLCLGMDIICIDPSQQFVHVLSNKIVKVNWQMPLLQNDGKNKQSKNQSNYNITANLSQLLHTVVITRKTSIPSLLSLFLLSFSKNAHKSIRVILLNKQIEQLLIEFTNRYLHIPQQILCQRLWIRVLSPHIRYPLLITQLQFNNLQLTNNNKTNLTIEYHAGSEQYYPHLNINFGTIAHVQMNKCITFYGVNDQPFNQKKHKIMTWNNINLKEELEMLTLRKLPKNIQKLEYMVIHKIDEELEKVMKNLPVILRKKIVYNRLDHKFNHKYFITFEDLPNKVSPVVNDIQLLTAMKHSKKSGNKQLTLNHTQILQEFLMNQNLQNFQIFQNSTYFGDYLTIFNINLQKQSKGKAYNNNRIHIGCIYQQNQNQFKKIEGLSERIGIGSLWRVHNMVSNQKINVKATVVYVMEGMALLYQQKQHHKSPSLKLILKNQLLLIPSADNFAYFSFIISIKQSTIAFIPYETYIAHKPKYRRQYKRTNILSDINNSLIQKLTPYQISILNEIGAKQTYEVGNKINYMKNQKVFFVAKGAIKRNYEDRIANTGAYLGDMLEYYYHNNQQDKTKMANLSLRRKKTSFNILNENKMQQQNEKQKIKQSYNQHQQDNQQNEKYVSVTKDTWVVQFKIQEFHHNFLRLFPHYLYYIYEEDELFH